MKKLIKLLQTSLICFAAPALIANSSVDALKAEKQNGQVKHGKNGKTGKSGLYGENGEDGQNGGNGGNGGFGWFQGGNGGRGGDGVDDSPANPLSEQTNQDNDELDYSTLKEMCRQVIFATVAKFYDSSEDECLLSLKTTISTYLTQVGTSAARVIADSRVAFNSDNHAPNCLAILILSSVYRCHSPTFGFCFAYLVG